MSTTVIIAEDHQLVRQGLEVLLAREGFTVVAQATTGHEAVALTAQHRPDVAILDIGLPVMNGLDVAAEIGRRNPETRAIMLTRHEDDQYVVAALRTGARGYVLKSQAAGDLAQAIREVCAGGYYLSPNVSRAVVEAFLCKSMYPEDRLSARERQVLQLVAEGRTTKEIAVALFISVKTAESHRSRLMEKLDLHSTAALVRYAIRHGLLEA